MDFIGRGVDLAKSAVEADKAGNSEAAIQQYTHAIKYFETGLKYEQSKPRKDTVTEKIKEYSARIEELKKAGKKVVKAHAGGGSSSGDKSKKKDGGGGGGKDDDDEKDPLQSQLQSAILCEKPNVKWEDVAGLDQAKALLKEAVILPIKFPQLFTGKRTPWKGILLYGPPGTGKSYLAKAVATEAQSTFLSVSSSDLVSKFQGESERLVKNLFEMARERRPSIIFIDEVDSLCGARSDGENESSRRIKTEFLVQMQGVGKDSEQILVLGATNTPWDLDPAIRRRFEKRVYIPLPELQPRAVMFKLNIGSTPCRLTQEDYLSLAQRTEGFSGSDISVVVRDALYEPVRLCQSATHFRRVPDPKDPKHVMFEPCSPGMRDAEEKDLMSIDSKDLRPPDISMQSFEAVLLRAKPSVGPEDLQRQEEWTERFGQEG